MIQVDSVGYSRVKDESNNDEDMKENGCVDIDNKNQSPSVKSLSIMSEEYTDQDNIKRDRLNDRHLSTRHQQRDREEITHNEDNLSDEENNDDDSSRAEDNDGNKKSDFQDRSTTPHGSLDGSPTANVTGHTAAAVAIAAAAAAAAAKSPVPNATSALPNEFNPAAFFPPPGQMSIQAFQNAIAQFTANALANNMDNDTVVKNLAILQSALFTLQQQQFLQFQLIQHLQSQLVKKHVEKDETVNDSGNSSIFSHSHNNNNHSKRNEPQDLRKQDRIEEDEEIEEEGVEDAYSKSFQMANIMAAAAAASSENRPIIHPVPEEELRKPKASESLIEKRPLLEPPITLPSSTAASSIGSNNSTSTLSTIARGGSTLERDEILPYQDSNFSSLAANIITDHAPSTMSEPNSLAMLEKKAQEVLNSASQGILSNNLLDELAFANDKSSPNGRNDAALFKHRCRYCGKIFGSDSSLQIHIRSHTGERPYKCNVCGSRFTTKGNLKVHFQRHSDKYPHIPMNPNPVPEHLDKYFPPLIPQEALKEQQQQQQQQAQPPPAPIPPPGPPTQFPNTFQPRAFFPDFYLPRPPLDMFSNPLNEPSRNPVDLSQVKKPVEPSREPTPEMRLSPEVVIHESPNIKQEPIEESLDLSDKSAKVVQREEEKDEIEQEKEDITITNNSTSEKEFPLKLKNNSVENLATVPSVSPPSSSSSGSLYQDTVLDPSFYSAHMPRPDSNDSSWENFIEISSETSKLQELVDNIDSKTTEPNQCLVCKKVLSCRSALQMHYRVHTGERPFRCKICGRSFTTKGNLKTHMSVHRIKPPMRTLHQCPVCHQKFSNIFVLQQHIRLHTGEMTDLTPDQIKAAEIKEYEGPDVRLNPFGVRLNDFPPSNQNKRSLEHSDEENEHDVNDEKSHKPPVNEKLKVRPGLTSPAIENQVEDLRAMNLQRLSVRSLPNEEFSRDSASASPNSTDAKRLRSSSPMGSISSAISTRSPMSTPPTSGGEQIGVGAAGRAAAAAAAAAAFPYGPPFLGMPQFPPFISRPPFLGNVPIVPPGANMPPFGLFGVRGNTTTCNICFKTFACNSALEIHYRSHTKERPFKCTICDRGFSTKGNMKQHMLTHKIRDMFGSSGGNSGDESRTQTPPQDPNSNSGGGATGGGSSNGNNRFSQSYSPASMDMNDDFSPSGGSKRERSNSSNFDTATAQFVKQEKDNAIDENGSNSLHSNTSENHSSNNNYQEFINKDVDIKNWCQKLKEMPENIVAS
ncbi:homeotic protein spalt-major-like [Aedes albopictus]|uniref:C2H2-type domain-containing protein n=1 Tax=Aedes albopictus TaxID=7160 RepID=A0ABM1YJ06_AEDAL